MRLPAASRTFNPNDDRRWTSSSFPLVLAWKFCHLSCHGVWLHRMRKETCKLVQIQSFRTTPKVPLVDYNLRIHRSYALPLCEFLIYILRKPIIDSPSNEFGNRCPGCIGHATDGIGLLGFQKNNCAFSISHTITLSHLYV